MSRMSVYLITIHTYRSWSEDNPRGYVQRGQSGVQPPQPKLAEYRAGVATDPPVRFDRGQMRIAVETAREVCVNLGERPVAASCTATHLHVLVELSTALTGRCSDSAPSRQAPSRQAPSRKGGAAPRGDKPVTPDSLCARIKSIVGLRLSEQLGTTGNRWFSRGKDIEPVKDDAHSRYLVGTYLPKHETHEGGIFAKWI